jgi:hypothetical protein
VIHATTHDCDPIAVLSYHDDLRSSILLLF